MSAEPLGVGVIGMSWVAGEHIKSYQLNPHTKVVALAGADANRVSSVAAAHSLASAKQYTRWQDLVDDPAVGIVSICSTNEAHVAQAVAAAKAGKHVLIEKPVSLDLDGFRQVEGAIAASGVKSQIGFELHWSPYFQSVH